MARKTQRRPDKIELGVVDIHTHVLPGIDDGAEKMALSYRMLRRSYKQGVRKVIATPHYATYHWRTKPQQIQELMEKLAARVRKAMPEDAYVLEISMKALEKWYGKAKVFEPLPKFPEEKRDLALVMDKDITCGQVEGCIREACAYVKDVSLFDVYEGRQIAADKKSMAFTVLFTPKEEAFKADTVDGYVKKVLKQLNKTYGIELRS